MVQVIVADVGPMLLDTMALTTGAAAGVEKVKLAEV